MQSKRIITNNNNDQDKPQVAVNIVANDSAASPSAAKLLQILNAVQQEEEVANQ
jgi:hypothetical protein